MEKFVNRLKLKGKMVEKGISVSTLSRDLDLSRTALYNKLCGRVDFSEREIALLKKTFGTYIFL